MKTLEKQTFSIPNRAPENGETLVSHDKEPAHGEGSLRDRLLTSPEARAAHIMLPPGTIGLEASNKTVSTETFFAMSDTVDRLSRGEPEDSQLQEPGVKKLGPMGERMSDLHLDLKTRNEMGESKDNLTLLYDANSSPEEGKLQIPSAVLVHESISDEEIVALRERLPEGVPIFDAATNELLDEVGATERKEARALIKLRTELGSVALGEAMSNAPIPSAHEGMTSQEYSDLMDRTRAESELKEQERAREKMAQSRAAAKAFEEQHRREKELKRAREEADREDVLRRQAAHEEIRALEETARAAAQSQIE